MPRLKSIIYKVDLDFAKKGHNCRHNRRHRIKKGDSRLGVSQDRSTRYYCNECALEMVSQGIGQLESLRDRLRETQLKE